uniref:Uncharacterized protein n=1 Tax=Lentinula edodes TaxID=5353 RepID=I7GSR4_LENED|nr:hypothetical protein [Lentinula edodes]
MALFKDLAKKYGVGSVLAAATLDGYRRTVLNDRINKEHETIRKKKNELSESNKIEYDKIIEEESKKTKTEDTFGRYIEAADDHKKAVDNYNTNPTEYNKNEMERFKNKLDKAYDEIKKLDISEYLSSLYNKYNEYLESLSPDKIVCIFNILTHGLILSSFFSVLSIMFSENIINQIGFLKKYPRILKLLKLRNNINKKVSKFYLLMHFITIILGLLGNIFMFFT